MGIGVAMAGIISGVTPIGAGIGMDIGVGTAGAAIGAAAGGSGMAAAAAIGTAFMQDSARLTAK
jgi:hypothetical protein